MTEQDVIAIDGPAASGKSTVARRLAARLGYLYVDSGALYRGVTWAALQQGISGKDWDKLRGVLGDCEPDFFVRDGAVRFRLGSVELDDELRTAAVNEHVSPVAAFQEVRDRVLSWLRGMSQLGRLVMEGRDIGTRVFPGARHKFYLDASPEERARRRHGESKDGASISDVATSLKRRDTIDSKRPIDPLKIAEDARVLDTTGMSIDQVVEAILSQLGNTAAC